MKYPHQTQLCFGLAAVRLIGEETQEGGHPFWLNRKNSCHYLDYKQLVEQEIYRLKNLKVGGSGWIH